MFGGSRGFDCFHARDLTFCKGLSFHLLVGFTCPVFRPVVETRVLNHTQQVPFGRTFDVILRSSASSYGQWFTEFIFPSMARPIEVLRPKRLTVTNIFAAVSTATTRNFRRAAERFP